MLNASSIATVDEHLTYVEMTDDEDVDYQAKLV